MDLANLVVAMGILLAVLLVLVIAYMYRKPEKKQPKQTASVKTANRASNALPTFDALERIVLNHQTSKEELAKAVDTIAGHYSKIHATTLKRYVKIIVGLCRHPQTDKNIILTLDKALHKANGNLKIEIDNALKKGLESRRG